jgi:hypothetical protein
VRFERSAHLTSLIADSERLSGHLSALDVPAEAFADARNEALLASLQLDGSTIPGVEQQADGQPRGWASAIRTRSDLEPSGEQLWEDELGGLATATEDQDLGRRLRDNPIATLSNLHSDVTAGLVADERRGQWRTQERTVTDTSVGRIVYWATKPADIGIQMAEVHAWLTGEGSREHALVRSGWLLLHLLRIQPFEAANGRVARAAARALLADGGLDPDGVAPLEQAQAQDAMGMFEEVARTGRRRDATVWLERWGETVTYALRRAVQALEPSAGSVESPRVLSELPDAFTITEWREAVGTADADEQLRSLLDAGLVDRVRGARGLRFVRTP